MGETEKSPVGARKAADTTTATGISSEMADDAVAANDLVVHRGRREVLHGLNFAVRPGAVTGLLGPSGCGKTTLMRAISGVQRIRSGDLRVLGALAGAASLRQHIGYVTQTPSVYGDLTVRQNTRHFALMYGLGRGEADEAIRDVGLGELSHRLVNTLSGGQRTRVSLACALVAHPKLLVLDEPTVGLDPVLRHDLWQRFHALAAEGTTLLVSSHVMDEADRCDHLLLLHEGQLVVEDTPQGLRRSTGVENLEEAFLRVVRGFGVSAEAELVDEDAVRGPAETTNADGKAR